MNKNLNSNKSWEQFGSPLFKIIANESDRGCVLVGAAYLESWLEKLLRYHLNPNEDKNKIVDELFKPESALGSFSSKIKISYCLKLINKDSYHDFEIIRKIRNICAHSSDNIFFGTKEVISLSANLKGADKAVENIPYEKKEVSETIMNSKNESDDYIRFREKTRFSMSLAYWLGLLAVRIEQIDKINELKSKNHSLQNELVRIVKKSIELGMDIPKDVMDTVKKYKLI